MDHIVHLYGGFTPPSESQSAPGKLEGRRRSVSYGGVQLECLDSDEVHLGPFEVSLEDLAAYLESQQRCYFEWDGSFMWTGDVVGELWQMCGMAYDVAGKLQRIELRGDCPYLIIASLLKFLSQGPTHVVAHLPTLGETITESELERLWHA